MIRILLILLIAGIAYLLLHKYLKKLAIKSIKPAQLAIIAMLLVVLGYLAVTGHLNWLFAFIGVALAYLLRIIPVFLQLAVQCRQLWESLQARPSGADEPHSEASAAVDSANMTVAEAYDILGLRPGADEQEIIAAHRRLMQKTTPTGAVLTI